MDYQKLFTLLPGPFLLFKADDPVFTFVDVSEAHTSMTGIGRADLVGKGFFDVFPDTSEKFTTTGVSDLAEVFREVIGTKAAVKSDPFRYDIKDASGEFVERYWEPVHYPILDGAGNVAYILQNTKDVTDSRGISEKLVETEQVLDLALKVGSLAVWDWDVEKNVVTGSDTLAELFGVGNERVHDGVELSVFADSIHADDRDRVLGEIRASIDGGEPFESEYRTMSVDGTVRWVIARGRLEHDADGKLTHFPGLIVDITARKQAEFNAAFLAGASKLLADSLDYRQTIDTVARLAIPDIADWCTVSLLAEDGTLEQVAVAHKDPDRIEWARQYSSRRTVSADDQTDASARVIRTGEPEFYPHITDEMIAASAGSDEELALVRSLELNSLLIAPLHDRDGTIGAVTMILTGGTRDFAENDFQLAQELADRMSLAITNAGLYDVSVRELAHRKRLQRDLKRANGDLERRVRERTAQLHGLNVNLERSNVELQNFAYVASHDLQEPLRKIQAFGDILNEEYAGELGDGADYLHRMQAAANRMSQLIEDLLAFSRVTTHAKPFTDVDLDSVLRDVIEDLSDRIGRTQGRVDATTLPHVRGDATQLRQLLQNLVANALKFHKPGEPPVVTVGGTVGDGMLTVTVADNGIGLDPKYADRIFAVFQRLHGREEYEGTGIGLAVCKKIVERHGGTIGVESLPGKGARFVVSLPLNKSEETE